jgi:hypothetical protein
MRNTPKFAVSIQEFNRFKEEELRDGLEVGMGREWESRKRGRKGEKEREQMRNGRRPVSWLSGMEPLHGYCLQRRFQVTRLFNIIAMKITVMIMLIHEDGSSIQMQQQQQYWL